jgi:site-specific DNA recombinase
MKRAYAIRTDTARHAYIYIRVSTSRQVRDGVGLETQEAKARAYAERQGWSVAKVFADEGMSGKDGLKDRPGLASLIDAVKADPKAVVIVYSISRLARRQRLLWQLLDDRDGFGLPVVSATEPFDAASPMGRAMLGMIAVFAQLEADMVSERTSDALAELKAQGKKLGAPSMADLGIGDSIRLVQQLYAAGGHTHVSLAEELNRRGVPTAKGGKWWAKTVRTALMTAL